MCIMGYSITDQSCKLLHQGKCTISNDMASYDLMESLTNVGRRIFSAHVVTIIDGCIGISSAVPKCIFILDGPPTSLELHFCYCSFVGCFRILWARCFGHNAPPLAIVLASCYPHWMFFVLCGPHWLVHCPSLLLLSLSF